MIKITDTQIFGWGAAIRAMRNPLNSWNKSDSYRSRGMLCDETGHPYTREYFKRYHNQHQPHSDL